MSDRHQPQTVMLFPTRHYEYISSVTVPFLTPAELEQGARTAAGQQAAERNDIITRLAPYRTKAGERHLEKAWRLTQALGLSATLHTINVDTTTDQAKEAVTSVIGNRPYLCGGIYNYRQDIQVTYGLPEHLESDALLELYLHEAMHSTGKAVTGFTTAAHPTPEGQILQVDTVNLLRSGPIDWIKDTGKLPEEVFTSVIAEAGADIILQNRANNTGIFKFISDYLRVVIARTDATALLDTWIASRENHAALSQVAAQLHEVSPDLYPELNNVLGGLEGELDSYLGQRIYGKPLLKRLGYTAIEEAQAEIHTGTSRIRTYLQQRIQAYEQATDYSFHNDTAF
jgi:hypothetical protein